MNTETGKTALITGASSGIGQELAKLFAEDGYNLVLVGRHDEKLDRLADVFRGNYGTREITVISKDLSEEDAAQSVYDEVIAKGITVNVLVNDAGASTYGLFATDTDWAREKQIIHLNVLATTLLTKLFLNDMVARNEGRILQLASLVAITPFPLMAVYAATKAYIWNLTQSLINEIKDTNVTMTALMPNATATNFFREAGAPIVNTEDILDDAAMVAKDAYKGLMKGEAKVIPGGLGNKAQEVMAYVSPQEMLAVMMRKLLSPKDERERATARNWAIGLGVAAAVVAGFLVTNALKSDDTVDELEDDAEEEYRTHKARYKVNNLIDDAEDSFSDAKEAAVDKWSSLSHTIGRTLASVFA